MHVNQHTQDDQVEPVVAHRIVLESIGTGGFAHLGVLRQVRSAPDARLAELLVQAPSELALINNAEDAVKVNGMLNECGLNCSVQSAESEFVAGVGEFDVAVFLEDINCAGEVIAEVGRLLGVDPAKARDLVCRAPPAILGNVSSATVEALRRRFTPLGASIVSSRCSDARYDVVTCEAPPRVRAHLLEARNAVAMDRNTAGPLLIGNLSGVEAEEMLIELSRFASNAIAIDREFQRFDIQIESCPTTPEAQTCLIELTDMPLQVANKIPSSTPMVLLSNVDRSTMSNALQRLDAAGVDSTAYLITLRHWVLRLNSVSNVEAAQQLVKAITNLDANLSILPYVTDPPISFIQARWLKQELGAYNAHCEIQTL